VSRLPNEAALDILSEIVDADDSGMRPLPDHALLLGILECYMDCTTSPPDYNEGEWILAYDAGREIARALLGLD
jgi:hypothetical protein